MKFFIFRSPMTVIGLLLFGGGCRTAPLHRTISVIPRDTAEAVWVTEHAGVAEATEKNQLRVYWNGPNGEDDVEQQIVLTERAINGGSYGIILSPNSPFALNTVIQRALSRRIPVVILGSPIPAAPAEGLFFLLNDVQQTGKLAAARVAQLSGASGEVAVVGLDPLSPGSKDRAEAFEKALQQTEPGIKVVDRLLGPFSFGQAELATEKTIRSHPHLSVIFTLNVTSTRGAVAALRTTNMADRIRVVGCDQTIDLLFLLRQGAVDSLVVQDMREMGRKAVLTIDEQHKTGHAAAYTYVSPRLVTKGNIDDESTQQLLMMNWRPSR